MATYGDVVDRTFRDYLSRPDDQPLMMELSGNGGSITSTATSFFVDVTLLTPEEEALIGAGTIIEIGSELIRVKAYDETDGSEQVTDCVRGILGSTAASHDDGDEIRIAPDYTRQQVFEAARDTQDDCYPQLYEVVTEQVTTPSTSSTNWTEAASDALDPLQPALVSLSGGGWDNFPVKLEDPFPPSPSNKAWLFRAPANRTAHVTYKKKATRPADETATLPDDTWERLLSVGAVAHLIAGEDIDAADAEYITEQLEAQSFQVGQGQSLRQALLSYYEYLKRKAVQRLVAEHGTPLKRNGFVVKGG